MSISTEVTKTGIFYLLWENNLFKAIISKHDYLLAHEDGELAVGTGLQVVYVGLLMQETGYLSQWVGSIENYVVCC